MILDTNALLWLETGHRRARPLRNRRLHVSPASLLEVQFLIEAGRIRLKRRATLQDLADDERWVVDEPPAGRWFEEARALTWTRDPFDRLIVAHAVVRGFQLATGDKLILENVDRRRTFEL